MKPIIVALCLVASVVMHAGAPVINAASPDAAVLVYDPVRARVLPIQTEYLGCLGIADSVSFEDGSIDCQPGAVEREQFRAQQARNAERAALHPTGVSFIPTEIESTTDR